MMFAQPQSTVHNKEEVLSKSVGSFAGGGKLNLVEGTVGSRRVKVLRDTGCTTIIVRSKYVADDEYTGKPVSIRMLDNTVRRAWPVRIAINTPYLQGKVNGLCMPDLIADLIIGEVPGAGPPGKQQQDVAGAVATRAAAKKHTEKLKAPDSFGCTTLSKAQLIEQQRLDPSLAKLRGLSDVKGGARREIWYETVDSILYRVSTSRRGKQEHPHRQVVVPTALRDQVMDIAHCSLMGGHLGARKTKDRILSNFYWPGCAADVRRFCQSCDVCQRTGKRGTVAKVPLQRTPLIDTPFKRVAIDIVGPIKPASSEGHRYILTLVDYATRYPEAVPLKRITTEAVAEALLDIYSRLGIPEEVIHDQGTQFMSDCMSEVCRLLSLKQLPTTPYHPMSNGLVEKFNGTLKTMLGRLCAEQPRQWHRYISSLLFAYREVPQESTGFAPFELLYGREVRGPMGILRELWTGEKISPEVKTSYQYVFDLRKRLEDTMALARDSLEGAQGRYKKYYDRKAKARVFKPGDEVLVLMPATHKLLMQWKGPLMVEARRGNVYQLKAGAKLKTYHVNLLKKYIRREEPASNLQPTNHIVQQVDSNPAHDMENAAAAVIEWEDDDTEGAIQGDLLEALDRSGPKTGGTTEMGKQLTSEQCKELGDLMQRYLGIFSGQPGVTDLITHHIRTSDEDPVRMRPYPIPYSLREALQTEVQEMMDAGVIRESHSPYAAPVVVVRKKDGTNRVCIDYRKLNKKVEFDPMPMNTAEDLLHGLGGARYFSKIDLSKGYWQIPVAEQDIHKTAFVTQDGHYEFLRMPFGMVNAGATLVRAIKILLEGMCGVQSYIDDIIVHSTTWEEHLQLLEELFRRIYKAGLTVRPSKCILGTDNVEFIGHVLHSGTMGPLQDNLEKVQQAPRPETKKEVRAFLGLTGYYRQYMPNYASIAAPLTDLTKKGQPNRLQWGEPQEMAYISLKSMLTSRPVLRLPDPSRPYVLRTDASDIGIGAVLLQEWEGELFPISYASKKLSNCEKRYSTMEKECLAVVWAVKKFNNYVYNTKFILQTDHQPLAYLGRAKYGNARIMRWAMYLQTYQIRVQAIKGSDNVGADFLSRAPLSDGVKSDE
ncbi:uncharacterized protein LOC122249376 [Penaeus japonicus]|uniref:uncharacterized protein LOC122249376 n=1 Tax=Penaeus japonicus TaxID=27405 RepID=UPI001C70D69C|nr:uncharacterized protein LOC122249376 [Penaeus japonicus]